MTEAGINISGQTSKDIGSLGNLEFDYVANLSGNARESCLTLQSKIKKYRIKMETSVKSEEG
jgi:hypothetical protein